MSILSVDEYKRDLESYRPSTEEERRAFEIERNARRRVEYTLRLRSLALKRSLTIEGLLADLIASKTTMVRIAASFEESAAWYSSPEFKNNDDVNVAIRATCRRVLLNCADEVRRAALK